ncbi:hypothetical protein RD110_22115 [Rhodoferax koreense]|uniref:EAL domain-containing protein n=1 Tax=Rhodoferax koreensis TaxID=1842727 RepID=A0A1P8K0P7_9BURK|nr:EAL domain-containing protein [Rhodoferax koreense]APW39572.1 hypothetical protein RD110_22115 [Rhodoferax koreense]
MRTGVVLGAEALIRWQHPERGLLFPDTFLPLIEKHPLSEALGAWVMEAALEQMDIWHRSGLQLPVSVNVSARQFQDQGFAGSLAALLSQYPNILPAHLELEILETSALDDVASVQKIIRRCHGPWRSFSLDDFGTGYSSLGFHTPAEMFSECVASTCSIRQR